MFNAKDETSTIDSLMTALFPVCRSITGDGVRETFRHLKKITDFDIVEIPSGTKCYDWTIPDEWSIRDAYIKDATGRRVVDFKENNLHVLNYSVPFEGKLTFSKLQEHLFSLPKLPDAIPYRTSYYKRSWGFCLADSVLKNFDQKGTYDVKVDSTLAPGSLTYADCYLKGESDIEILISSYCCHPSMANDSLSGVVLWTLLLRALKTKKLKYSYRFVCVPETIGAIAFSWKNEGFVKRAAAGLVMTTTGGPGKVGYKPTFLGDHFLDRTVRSVFQELKTDFVEYKFDINGSDERQYSTPAFRLPVGSITKDKYYEYEFYHTSLDDLDFVTAEQMTETLDVYFKVIEKIESLTLYRSNNPACEPQLGKRGLYPNTGGGQMQTGGEGYSDQQLLDAICWVLFYGDGKHSLECVSIKTGISMEILSLALKHLKKGDLVTV